MISLNTLEPKYQNFRIDICIYLTVYKQRVLNHYHISIIVYLVYKCFITSKITYFVCNNVDIANCHMLYELIALKVQISIIHILGICTKFINTNKNF